MMSNEKSASAQSTEQKSNTSRISFFRRAQPQSVGDDSNFLRLAEQQMLSEVAEVGNADPLPTSVDCDDLKPDQDPSHLTSSQKKLRFFISSRSLNDSETKTLQPATDLDNKNDDEWVPAETNAGMGLFELQRNIASYRSLGNSIAENARDETLQQLNLVYDKKYRERQIKYQARVLSVRQTFAGSLIFMAVFLTGSVAFFSKTGNVPVPDAILFAFYTMTTCGFGSVVIPHTTPFLSYVIFFIFVSIAGLVILVSQIYQIISLEASHAKTTQSKPGYVSQSLQAPANDTTNTQKLESVDNSNFKRNFMVEGSLRSAHMLKSFIRHGEWSRTIVSFFYMISLLLIGTGITMKLEDWSFPTALYYCSYVMTTVGYGNIAPTNRATVIFSIFYVPLNVSFIAVYMGTLARLYAKFCNANTERIKRQQMKLFSSANAPAVDLRAAVTQEGDDQNHRKSIHTMQDLVSVVTANIAKNDQHGNSSEIQDRFQEFFSLRSTWGRSFVFNKNSARKPSFALLVLVQERLVKIIAVEIAGKKSRAALRDTTLLISFDSLDDTVAKWMIPAGAEEPFRAAVFETLLYVGENKVVTQGAESILALTPFELLQILAPLLAAMADAGTMEGWLSRTEKLASEYFPRTSSQPV